MSDKKPMQSDTSRTVKNPLLSAAVTGLTFDDFTHNAVLLPAAVPPPQPSAISSSVGGKENQGKSVVFGGEPACLDTESFSEISLDKTNESTDTIQISSDYNPLQNLDTYSDVRQIQNLQENNNSGPSKLESAFNPLVQASSLTAQLSQLPSVASSVLSSFSNILIGNSPTPVTRSSSSPTPSPASAPELDGYSRTENQQNTTDILNYHQNLLSINPIDEQHLYKEEQPPPPVVEPTFYSPNDTVFLKPSGGHPSIPINTQPTDNVYRLSAKKKIYAPVPGLNANTIADTKSNFINNLPTPVPPPAIPQPFAPTTETLSDTASINNPSNYFYQQQQQQHQHQQQHQQQQQHHQFTEPTIQPPQPSGGSSTNKFSLSSFFSTPLINKFQSTNNQYVSKTDKQFDNNEIIGITSVSTQIQNSGSVDPQQQQQSSDIGLINQNLFKTTILPAQPIAEHQQQIENLASTNSPVVSQTQLLLQNPSEYKSQLPHLSESNINNKEVVTVVPSSPPPPYLYPQIPAATVNTYQEQNLSITSKQTINPSYSQANIFGVPPPSSQLTTAPITKPSVSDSVPTQPQFGAPPIGTTSINYRLSKGSRPHYKSSFTAPYNSSTAVTQNQNLVSTFNPVQLTQPSEPIAASINYFNPPLEQPTGINFIERPPTIPTASTQESLHLTTTSTYSSSTAVTQNQQGTNNLVSTFNPVQSTQPIEPIAASINYFNPPLEQPTGINFIERPPTIPTASTQESLHLTTTSTYSSSTAVTQNQQATNNLVSTFNPVQSTQPIEPIAASINYFNPPLEQPTGINFIDRLPPPTVSTASTQESLHLSTTATFLPAQTPSSLSQPSTVAALESGTLDSTLSNNISEQQQNNPTAINFFNQQPSNNLPLSNNATINDNLINNNKSKNSGNIIDNNSVSVVSTLIPTTSVDAPLTTPQPPISDFFASTNNSRNEQQHILNNWFNQQASNTNLNQQQQHPSSTIDTFAARKSSTPFKPIETFPISSDLNPNPVKTTGIDPINFFNNNSDNNNNINTVNIQNNNIINQGISEQQQERQNYIQIQNFFNNPPLLSDRQEGEQDRNYNNIIETNIVNKRLQNLTILAGSGTSSELDTPSFSSNIVEPPSSIQSEFSEFLELSAFDNSMRNEEISNQLQSNAQNYFNSSDQQLDSVSSMADKTAATTAATATIEPAVSATIETLESELSSSPNGAVTNNNNNNTYRPIYKHWFYKKIVDTKAIWTPFSMLDSMNLEDGLLTQNNLEIVTTDGGRFDVNIPLRQKTPIYWNADPNEVRRCSWFYKGVDSRYVPYEEATADLLENEYQDSFTTGQWRRKIQLPNGEMVIFHGASVMVHFLQSESAEGWPNASSAVPTPNRPRVVKRGIDEFNIDDGEPEQVDHLLFMVHGIGAACDLKFRSVEEVVDEFRSIALQLVQSHYRSACDKGEVGRIEVLPISWHNELHSEESGIDEKLKAITLESIPKLRNFTNETLLDVLFYTSPVFCQQIMDTVSGSLNRLYKKYCERNPSFHGDVSLAGHSLGSLILFDLLQHQEEQYCDAKKTTDDTANVAMVSDDGNISGTTQPLKETLPQQKINYNIGIAGTGQPFVNYPHLIFKPKNFFALGSPIGMFITIRGIDRLGLDFKFPTTDGFYNIFHPYDPVAYRIEALVNSELSSLRPVLIPHHKGRKRMHLELRETMTRVSADIKQKIIDTFRHTLDRVYSFTLINKTNDSKAIEHEVDKAIEEQLNLENSQCRQGRSNSSTPSDIDNGETNLPLGALNEGKRIDYVLQEAPLEFFNEYLFALTSHVCYWESEDTTLFIMKEIYSSLGIKTDNKIPQQTMTVERRTTSSQSSQSTIS